MKTELDKNYKKNFKKIINFSQKEHIDKVEITNNNLFSFKDIMSDIYNFLDFEKKFEIRLSDFPYCVINEIARDHIIFKNQGEKKPRCGSCMYDKICQGFPSGYLDKLGQSELEPVEDKPKEVMIEVESRCNFGCEFCYNHNSFAKKGRGRDNLSSDYIKKIIDHVSEIGVKTIRFTGGEPMLRENIFELMKYAKSKDLEVRLNTNGSLVNRNNILKMKGVVDNILIPIESWAPEREEKITGYKKSLELKINAISLFKKINTPVIRVGTVAIEDNIKNFKKLSNLILSLPVHEWEFYRPITGSKKHKVESRKHINELVDNILNIQNKTNIKISIANALPFCSIGEPWKLNNISSGALFDDGHSRLVVDPRGFLKPHYFLEKNIGDPLNILGAWNSDFMKKMRNLEFLPVECKNCRFKFKCRGGSRHEAELFNKKINSPDPLVNFKNIT